ncbi:Uncharacterized protein APZ42_000429 [Daphnia magna]|uniref:Uncharacterized protein n=1 Tax=Daphnia magna TaxID=35525 RepID=A0A164JNK4_9CRUS|nr:Uncharacterized protein APZ42_000429 [Daphnia magna]
MKQSRSVVLSTFCRPGAPSSLPCFTAECKKRAREKFASKISNRIFSNNCSVTFTLVEHRQSCQRKTPSLCMLRPICTTLTN